MDFEDLSESRNFIVTNVSLTITYVTFAVAVLMVTGFILSALIPALSSSSSHSYYRSFPYGSDRIGDNDLGLLLQSFVHGGTDRSKRSATSSDSSDQALARKMDLIEKSFKSFDMADLGCQMMLSCESAQLETLQHPVFGEVTPKIHKLLSTAKMSRGLKPNPRIAKLLEAHREGRRKDVSCKKLYSYVCPDSKLQSLAAASSDRIGSKRVGEPLHHSPELHQPLFHGNPMAEAIAPEASSMDRPSEVQGGAPAKQVLEKSSSSSKKFEPSSSWPMKKIKKYKGEKTTSY